MSDIDLPSISLVTPNFNGGKYLAEAIGSIVGQNYPRLEYIIADGGSTDRSIDIVDRYAARIDRVLEGPDEGQYDALNKGFALSCGEIMGWLNSDDVLMPNALTLVAEIFQNFPEVRWLTTSYRLSMDVKSRVTRVAFIGGFNADTFYNGANLPFSGPNHYYRGAIQQESTFWRRSLWEEAGGGLATEYELAADFELWGRFFRHAPLHALRAPIGCSRRHPEQRSFRFHQRYHDEAATILARTGRKPLSAAQSYVRRRVNGVIGNGPANGSRNQPKLLLRLLRFIGLISPAPVIVKQKGVAEGWHPQMEFIV